MGIFNFLKRNGSKKNEKKVTKVVATKGNTPQDVMVAGISKLAEIVF